MPQDKELTRFLLASAIIDQVDAGLRYREELGARAVAALLTAKNIASEKTASRTSVRPRLPED